MNNGERINQYTLIRLLGKGGMSEVYLVEDNLGRPYALKILSARLTEEASFRERFKHEARIMASLNHPHIVGLHSYFEEGDSYCLAMEYLAGGSLKDLIKRSGPLPESQALAIFRQIAQALDHAHSQGVIHRDVKPSNILIGADGNYKLGDFGIARMKETEGLTRTGSRMGTLIYMSPEQIRDSKHVDAKTDVYSLGVTLYEMLTGLAPYNDDEDSEYEIMDKIVRQDLPEPRAIVPSIGKVSVDLIKKSTCRETCQRPEFSELLAGPLSGQNSTHPENPEPIGTDTKKPPQPLPETMIVPAGKVKKKSSAGLYWSFFGIILIALAILMIYGNRKTPVSEEVMQDTLVAAEVEPAKEPEIEPVQETPAKNAEEVVEYQVEYYGQWLDDYSSAISLAQRYSRPILFHWSASSWCDWCVKLSEEVIDTPTFYNYVSSRYILLRYDNPSDKSPYRSDYYDLQSKYEVNGYPTILILDSHGNLQTSIVGYKSGGPDYFIQNYLP